MKTAILARAFASLLVMAAGASAGQEQRLRYNSSGLPHYYVGNRAQYLTPRSDPPKGMRLPALADEKPLFALWKFRGGKLTGRAPRDGGRCMAFDISRRG